MRRIDATQGPILKSILVYTFPLIVSIFIQSLFHTIDIVVLGSMANSGAVAAVGATSSVIALTVNTFFGFSGGAKILMARNIGARNKEAIRNITGTSLLTSVGLGTLIAVLGMIFSIELLDVTNCPTECYNGALVYFRIYICSAPAILRYNLGSSPPTAWGDTERPLYYIIASGLLNIVLNVLLCLLLEEKVAAVAIATLASQLLGAFLVCHRLFTMKGESSVTFSTLRWDNKTFLDLLHFGAPLALHTGLYPLANLQIQSAVNAFGVAAISGDTASGTLESYPSVISSALSTTTTTFMAQNIGAGQHDRVKKSFRYCTLLCLVATAVISIALYSTGRFWAGMIVHGDEAAIDYAMTRMFYLVLFYPVAAVGSILNHAIQAYGHPLYSSLNSIISVFGFRMIFMAFIYPYFMTFESLIVCYLISWWMVLIVNAIGYLIYNRAYRKSIMMQTE